MNAIVQQERSSANMNSFWLSTQDLSLEERNIGSKREKTKKAASGVRNKKARNWAGGDSEKKLEKGWMRKVHL